MLNPLYKFDNAGWRSKENTEKLSIFAYWTL